MNYQRWQTNLISKCILAVGVFVITYVITLKLAFNYNSDYIPHMKWALDIFKTFGVASTYPLWHLIVKLVYEICHSFLPVTIEYITATVTGFINALTYWIVANIMERRECPASPLVAFPIMFVTALYLPWFNHNIYLGQGSPNTWHSPSALMVRPFAVLSFFYICDICSSIQNGENIQRKKFIILSMLIFLTTLSKPSFFQGIVPALGLFILIMLAYKKGENIKHYISLVLTFVPAFSIVLTAFIVSFYAYDNEGIGFGWMEVWKGYSPHPVFSFITVVCFPVLYIVLNLKQAIKNLSIQLSSLYLLSGFLNFALFYENGFRKLHANFSWALNLSYFIIWIVTSINFFKDWSTTPAEEKGHIAKNIVLMIIWLLHFASGLYYAGLFLFHEGFTF